MNRRAQSIAAAFACVIAALSVQAPVSATPSASASVGAAPDLAAPGPYAVTSTTQVKPCVGPAAVTQNADVRRQGARTPLLCTPAAPIGTGPDIGVDFYAPVSAPGPRPLIVFVGGSNSNPGYFQRLMTHWASHGFVVAVAYNAREIAPESHFLGLRRAIAADNDPRSPLYHRIDPARVILAGHSSGATKALEAASIIGARLPRSVVGPFAAPPGVVIAGVLAIAPDVNTVVGPIRAKTLVTTGTADKTARPDQIRRVVVDRLSTPTWFTVAHGNPHLTAVDPVTYNPLTRIQLAFLRYTAGDPAYCPVFAGPTPRLDADPVLARSERNTAARATTCPAP